MVKCKYYIDFYNKKNIIDKNVEVDDKLLYMKNNLKKQIPSRIYFYRFDDGDKYISINVDNTTNKNDFIIEQFKGSKLEERMILKFMWKFYGNNNLKSRDDVIDSINNSISKIIKQYPDKFNEFNEFDQAGGNRIDYNETNKLKQFLTKLDENKDAQNILNKNRREMIDKIYELDKIKNNKLNKLNKSEKLNKLSKETMDNYIQKGQSGGIIIWLIEKAVSYYLPNWISFIFTGILEIIDIGLGIASAIPGLQAVYGAGVIIDVISIIYSILRFDIIGTIAGLISLIPGIGDIIGGVTKFLGKAGKYLFKGLKYVFKYGDEAVDVARFGIKYGDDIIKYGYKIGKQGVGLATDIGKRGVGLASNIGRQGVGLATDIGKQGIGIASDIGRQGISKLGKYGDTVVDLGKKAGKFGLELGKEAVVAGVSEAEAIAKEQIERQLLQQQLQQQQLQQQFKPLVQTVASPTYYIPPTSL